MALKAVLKSLDGLDEALHAFYRKEGDVYVLDVSDSDLKDHPGTAPLKNALDREREEKKTSKAALDALQAKFGDLDPEAAREALAKLTEQGDKDLLDEGKIEELIAQRTDRMRADFDKQLAAKDTTIATLTSSNENTTKELSSIKIFDAVKDAALGKGARKEALLDIQNRARETWTLDDKGTPVARSGEDAVYGKNGDALTISEWVDTLSAEATYLFNPNQGGGAPGDGGNQGGGGAGGGDIKRVSAAQAGGHLEAIAKGEVVIDRST